MTNKSLNFKTLFSVCCIGAWFVLVLPGCLLTRYDIKNQESEKQMAVQLQNLQKINADTDNHVVVLDQTVRELNGRVEIIESQRREQEQKSANKDLEKETKFQIYEQAIAKNEKEIQELKAQIEELKKKAQEKPLRKATKSTKVSVPKGNFKSAEYYFEKKDWKIAITNYQKYREMNPKGKKYAEATYKIGVCFQELGMIDNAKIFFQEVVEKFPKTKESKKSQYRIKKL